MTTQSDPLAAFRIVKYGAKASTKPEYFPEEELQNPLDQYRIKPPESSEKYNIRDIARIPSGLGARSAESIVGAPGDIQKGFGGLLDLIIGAPAEYVSGKDLSQFRQLLRDPHSALGKQREEVEQIERSQTPPGEISSFSRFPTSEDIRENITKPASQAIGGNENSLEPKSEPERFAQEFTQDLIRLALPGSGVKSWLGRLGLSLSSNTSKEVAKQLGFSPSTQELAKLGTLGIVSLAQIGNAPKFAGQLFQDTKSMMPNGVRFNSIPLQNALNTIKNTKWFRGHTTPSTRAAREMIGAIEQRIQNGTLGAQEAMTLRENINELAHNLGAFAVDRSGKTTHITHLNEVRDALIQGMEQTLGRQYPKWWNQYQTANQAYAITQKSNALGNFIANNYAKPITSEAGKVLFGNALAKGAAGIAKFGIAGAGIASGAKLITLTNRIAKSPTLRKYYKDVIIEAGRGNAIAMANALNKFDQEAIKEEKLAKARRPLLGQVRK